MYVDDITILNVGPISKFSLKPKFDEQGNPYPIVVIGDNGKGKTTLSSYIADALIEIAKNEYTYRNIVQEEGAYFKVVSNDNIKRGEKYSLSVTSFKAEKPFSYIEKSGKVNQKEVENYIRSNPKYDYINNKIKEESFSKGITNEINSKDIENIFDSNVLCFFPSYRSEKPSWMNDNAIKYNEIYEDLQRINGILNKEIIVEHAEERNSKWIHSVIVDSLIDIDEGEKDELGNKTFVIKGNVYNQQFLKKAKENLEKILQLIFKSQQVELSMNYRNQNNSFKMVYQEKIERDGSVVTYLTHQLNSLKEFSLGQAVLFNIFATIIRHADFNNIKNSVDLSKIEGIVVIDEIDMHLDSEMQNEVLPKLIKLFPKIQFIITSHSPLFLLGMDKEFKDKYMLIEMPKGESITIERFSEFEKSYRYLSETKKHEEEISNIVDKKIKEISENTENKPLIITEGKTDWKHLKNALMKLKEKGNFKDLDIEFYEFDFDMGESELVKVKDALIKLPIARKIILISDRDTENTDIKKFEEDGKFKRWNNSNVYTFRIPIPPKRIETPKICIEHYYTDEEIKTEFEIEGIKKRLFLANEFNPDTGDFLGEESYRTCKRKWNNPIEIFDSSDKCKVTKFKDINNTTYSLSKEVFASRVKELKNLNYDDFSLIFNIIREIINSNKSQS